MIVGLCIDGNCCWGLGGGFFFVVVQVVDYVLWVIWFVCFVYVVVMQDQLVVCVEQEFGGDYFDQQVFYCVDVFVRGQFGVVGYVEDVGVYCYYWFVEGGVEYYVGCFVVYVWQCFEGGVIMGYFVIVVVDQQCVGGDYVFCFGVEQFNGGDVFF